MECFLLGPTDVAGIVGVLTRNSCAGDGHRRSVFIETSEDYVVAFAGRYAECHQVQEGARTKPEKYEDLLETIEYLRDAAERAHDHHGAQDQADEGASEQVQVLQGDPEPGGVCELFEATVEPSKLTVERWNQKGGGTLIRPGGVSGDQSFEGKTEPSGSAEHRNPGVPGVVLDQRVTLWDSSTAGSASGVQKKEVAVVRKESVDMQEYEPYNQKVIDMDVDEWSFVPRAVGFAGLREPRFQCDGRCQGQGFKCWEIATEMVEDDGEACTVNLRKSCHNQRRERAD